MRSVVRRVVPAPARTVLRAGWNRVRSPLREHLYYPVTERLEEWRGRRDPMVPPLRLMFDGPVDYAEFRANGAAYLRYYIQLCDLRPSSRMLDIGSGIGRKTVPLTRYLTPDGGRYEGFDIVKTGVEWCRRRISTRYKQFHFQLADIYNKHYNQRGTYKPSEYKFQFSDEYFDVVVANSVFTHMLPEDTANYVSEAARVLKPGGRCLVTFFLLNDESRSLIAAGRSSLDFRHQHGPYRTVNDDVPEQTVAYDESFVLDLLAERGLVLRPPVHYGSWCGRANYLDYQDIVVAAKT